MSQFEKDIASIHCDLFYHVREYLLSQDDVEETQKPRITTYANKSGGICHLRTMPHGIDIGFLKGAKMTDQMELLTGNGKAMRVLSMDCFDEKVIGHYVQQALDLNG